MTTKCTINKLDQPQTARPTYSIQQLNETTCV